MCEIFLFEQWSSKPKLFGCADFPKQRESYVSRRRCFLVCDGIVLLSRQMGMVDYRFFKSFYLNREFRSQSCSAPLIFRNPRKAMFDPKSVSWGVTGSYHSVYYMGMGITVFAKSFCSERECWGQSCSAVLISGNPRKAMFGPKSASKGVTESHCWVYYIWVWGNTKFSKSFHYNRQVRSQNCSTVLIFHNPQKAMFGPESASWGVTGSYRWVCYMGMGDY